MTSTEDSHQPPLALPRMWHVFVYCCLVFSFLVAVRLVVDYPGLPSFLIGLAGLTAMTVLFLWIALRNSLSPADVSATGVHGSVLQRRLLLLTGLLLLNIGLIPILSELQLWWLLAYIMIAAGLALPLLPAKLVIGGLTVLSLACAAIIENTFQPILLVQPILGLGAIVIRTFTVANIQLEASRDDIARLAIAEERLRFARDLHDSLGQSLSTIILKSELGGRIVCDNAERATEEIRDVEEVARRALSEVRSVVTGYRQPSLNRELASARDLLNAAHIAATVEHTAGQLPADIDGLFAWAVREGTTNVVRHSRARECTIRIGGQGDTVRLEIVDNGNGVAALPAHYSNGLAGLAERADRVGGFLSSRSLPEGGFELVLQAPLARKSTVMST